MRFRHFTLAAFALLLGLAACRKAEPENSDVNSDQTQTEEFESTAMTFTATGLNFNTATTATTGTRATVDGNWEGVSSVGVMIVGTVKEYTVAADATDNTSATLSSTDPHYWSTDYDDITVTAWWPYTDGDTAPPDVVVNENQSLQTDFEGSDFISAEQTVSYSSPILSFTHRTARVTVNLVAGDGVTNDDLAYATVSLTGLSNDYGNPSTITPYNSGSNTYEALLLPQTITTGTSFIQVKLEEETSSLSPEDDLVLDANYHYTYTIKVDATGLELVGSSIGDWESGGSDESGTAEELHYTYDSNSNSNTYTVYSAEGLLAWNTAAQTDLELNCTLAADIDMTGKDWTLVGKDSGESNRYTGTFDGGGHTITGLTINQSGADDVGLIGCLGSGGVVQNLTMYNVSIIGYRYVGGVVGSSYAGTVTACSVSGSVSGSSYVGSVVGYNYYSGTVTACYAWGSVTSTNSNVGGVVGYNLNAGTVTACYWDCDADCDGGENGLGGGSGETTKVDGSTTTWQNAVDGMNEAIDKWNEDNPGNQCNWEYELLTGNDYPTLKKTN